MIKAIFFDLEGVITKEGKVLQSEILPFFKGQITFNQLKKRYHLGKVGKLTEREFFKGVPEKHWFDYLEMIDYHKGAKQVLSVLSKKYSLYVSSNHIQGLFEKEINHLKAKRFFKRLFVSYKMKKAKPHKNFFQQILKDSKQKAIESIFVDDAKGNLETAKKVGFVTVWVNNKAKDKRNNTSYVPDYEIRDLKELISIVEKINN